MEPSKTLYDSVYRKVVTDIYQGQLCYGDELPSLQELCQKYSVGRNTARSAVQLLAENGYVEQLPGRKARVVYDFNCAEHQRLYLNELWQRRDAIGDVFWALGLLMPDIAEDCLRFAGPKSLKIRALVEQIEQTARDLSVRSEIELYHALHRIYRGAIELSGNELLLSMFEDLYDFVPIPLSQDERRGRLMQLVLPMVRLLLKRFERSLHYEDYRSLKSQVAFFCRTMQRMTVAHLDRVCADMPRAEQVGFVWLCGRRQNLLYSHVVSDVLEKIGNGIYCPGDSLPSYAELAQESGVSERTSRKAVSILNRLGVVSTANGRNSRVAYPSERSPAEVLWDPFVQEHLTAFLEAAQIMAMVSRPVVYWALEHTGRWQLEQIESQIESPAGEPLIAAFFQRISSPAVQEIYRQLRHIMAWGNVLEFFAGSRRGEMTEQNARRVLEYFRLGNVAAVADEMRRFYCTVFHLVRDYVTGFGIRIDLSVPGD